MKKILFLLIVTTSLKAQTVASVAICPAIVDAQTGLFLGYNPMGILALGLDKIGKPVPMTKFTWKSSDTTIATVVAGISKLTGAPIGLVTAKKGGAVIITATYGTKSIKFCAMSNVGVPGTVGDLKASDTIR